MVQLGEYTKMREELLNDSKDDDGFISEPTFIEQVLPLMLDAKLIDSDYLNEAPYNYEQEKIKINGYLVNESGERLQLFIVNEDSIQLKAKNSDLLISQKAYYENQFNRGLKFINKAVKGNLADLAQDSSPVQALITQLSSVSGIEQFDVIEIFVLSATITIETRGLLPQPKKFQFDDEKIKLNFPKNLYRQPKEVLIIKRLIDINFIFNVLVSQGNREALIIDFQNEFKHPIEVIKAADEEQFESYLCVLPASIISALYKVYSSRLLEKNVRSFLEFRGVNKGIRETIREYPQKFIAFNNGLTITSTGKELLEIDGRTYIKSLTDFQIVNGGQTTASIYFTHKDGFDISLVKVMAKINVAKNVTEEEMEDLITKISRYSNYQTKVSNVDLRSRSPQLIKLKVLSDSVLSPSGLKWFFEKSKGEFNTLLRKAGSSRSRIEKEHPKFRRFTKEELGKYYCSWGEQPFMIKKGGEKVFRYFIAEISGENDKNDKEVDINRFFYEELIAKIILFRSLEKIYGQGKNSKGQLRSAVVPYSISIVYKFTNGSDDIVFDLSKLWASEELKEDISTFFDDLMTLMNELIKKYSESDDYGEYSKKLELWARISGSKEIEKFMSTKNASTIIEKYCISKEDYLKKQKKRKAFQDLNFEPLIDSAEIFSNTKEYYKFIKKEMASELSQADISKLDKIIEGIQNKSELPDVLIDFEKTLTQKIRSNSPELFDEIICPREMKYVTACAYIIKEYNYALDKGIIVKTHFINLKHKFEKKGEPLTPIFVTLGETLEKGKIPTIKDLSILGDLLGRP
ncbi:MAG: AIPR family protein [Bacteroidia bacterium]